jgi:prolyl-tRNA editing enzyme YbaK/EbsC (Cys-tRNA(Pro) deacylase)
MIDALTLHRLLVESGTQHEIVHLARAISSADQLPEVLRLPPNRCLAVRMYDAGGVLTAVIVHAGSQPAAGALREVTGSRRVLPVPADRVNSATGYAAELVAPLALPDNVEFYADEDVVCGLDNDVVVYTATGESGTALGVRLLDLFTLLEAKPAALTRPRSDGPPTAWLAEGCRS